MSTPPPSHLRYHRDRAKPGGVGDDLRLALMNQRGQHRVADTALGEQARDALGLLD